MRNRSQRQATDEVLKLTDQATDCCRNIETLGLLLAFGDDDAAASCLEPKVAAWAGWMVSQEARKLHALIEATRKKLVE